MNLRNLAWSLALLALGGCAALPPAPPPAAVIAPEDLLQRLRARQELVKSFEARGRITMLSPERNYSGSGLLKAQAPSTLRVDVYDFLGRSLLSFASDGREVEVLSPREAKFYRGPSSPANLAAFIPPTVTLPQALRLLTAAVPLSPAAPARVDYQAAPGQYFLEWLNPDGTPRERLWVAAQGQYPAKEEWWGDSGRLLFSVEWADYGHPALDLPGKITLRASAPATELRLTYSELQVNPALTPADLALQAPPGVTVVPLP